MFPFFLNRFLLFFLFWWLLQVWYTQQTQASFSLSLSLESGCQSAVPNLDTLLVKTKTLITCHDLTTTITYKYNYQNIGNGHISRRDCLSPVVSAVREDALRKED